MSNNGAMTSWADSPAGKQLHEHLSEERTLQALDRLLYRLDAIEKAVDRISNAMDQGPGIAAMMGDMVDEAYRKANERGVNLDERLHATLAIAEKLTEPEMGKRLDQIITMADQLPGMMAMGIDIVDDSMRTAVQNGFDPQALGKISGAAVQALVEAQQMPPAQVGGIFGLLRAIGDSDRQRALGFLMNYLKVLGQKL